MTLSRTISCFSVWDSPTEQTLDLTILHGLYIILVSFSFVLYPPFHSWQKERLPAKSTLKLPKSLPQRQRPLPKQRYGLWLSSSIISLTFFFLDRSWSSSKAGPSSRTVCLPLPLLSCLLLVFPTIPNHSHPFPSSCLADYIANFSSLLLTTLQMCSWMELTMLLCLFFIEARFSTLVHFNILRPSEAPSLCLWKRGLKSVFLPPILQQKSLSTYHLHICPSSYSDWLSSFSRGHMTHACTKAKGSHACVVVPYQYVILLIYELLLCDTNNFMAVPGSLFLLLKSPGATPNFNHTWSLQDLLIWSSRLVIKIWTPCGISWCQGSTNMYTTPRSLMSDAGRVLQPMTLLSLPITFRKWISIHSFPLPHPHPQLLLKPAQTVVLSTLFQILPSLLSHRILPPAISHLRHHCQILHPMEHHLRKAMSPLVIGRMPRQLLNKGGPTKRGGSCLTCKRMMRRRMLSWLRMLLSHQKCQQWKGRERQSLRLTLCSQEGRGRHLMKLVRNLEHLSMREYKFWPKGLKFLSRQPPRKLSSRWSTTRLKMCGTSGLLFMQEIIQSRRMKLVCLLFLSTLYGHWFIFHSWHF